MNTNPNKDADQLLNVSEAAKLLRLSPGTLYHFVAEKRVPVIKVSARCVRFSRTALLLWLDGLTQLPDESPSGRHSKKIGRTQ